MLQWTRAGAVPEPTALQIRVTRRFPGRVRAGAPAPRRSLDPGEIVANLRHFTVDRRGPRTRPCTRLVLSGVDLAGRDDLAGAVDQARAWGIERVTLHLGRGDRQQLARSPLGRRIDAAAMVIRDEADLADLGALRGAPGAPHVTAVVLLSEQGLPRLEWLARGLARVRPDQVVFTWPLPPSDPPPRARRATQAASVAVDRLDAAGIASGVKGLPACALGPLGVDRLWRSGNRWYVDAAHQLGDALLFFPDVIRFAKRDVCRFCAVADRCDGAPAPWLEQGLAGVLTPFDERPDPDPPEQGGTSG